MCLVGNYKNIRSLTCKINWPSCHSVQFLPHSCISPLTHLVPIFIREMNSITSQGTQLTHVTQATTHIDSITIRSWEQVLSRQVMSRTPNELTHSMLTIRLDVSVYGIMYGNLVPALQWNSWQCFFSSQASALTRAVLMTERPRIAVKVNKCMCLWALVSYVANGQYQTSDLTIYDSLVSWMLDAIWYCVIPCTWRDHVCSASTIANVHVVTLDLVDIATLPVHLHGWSSTCCSGSSSYHVRMGIMILVQCQSTTLLTAVVSSVTVIRSAWKSQSVLNNYGMC